MNIFKNFEKKNSSQSIFAYDNLSEPRLTSSGNYNALLTEGYKKNIIVFRCVNLIAKSIASVNFILSKNSNTIEKHPLKTLLSCPSQNTSWHSFIESAASHLLLAGNSYIRTVYSEPENPKTLCELQILKPENVSINTFSNGYIKEYIYNFNKKPLKIAPEELIHLKSFNPFDDIFGLSPLAAAIKSIDQHNAISNHNISILQNGGRPSGCLMVKNYKMPLSREQRDYLQNQLESAYSGTKNSGKIMLLEGDFEWKEMGLSPKDMDFVAAKKLSAREIAQAFSVPPVLVGIEEDATFSNYKEARFHFWEDTVLPLVDYIFGEINNKIIRKFDESMQITYNADAIPALTPRREAIWKQITNADFLTPNEKRIALGYSPISDGERYNR